MDETATIHEKFYAAGSAIAQYLPFDVFSYRWVIVGVIIAIVVALALLPFVLSLPRPVTIGVIAGGAVFLAGAERLHLDGTTQENASPSIDEDASTPNESPRV